MDIILVRKQTSENPATQLLPVDPRGGLYYYVTGKPELCNSTHGWKTFFGWDLVPEVQYPILIFSLFILTRWWSRIYSKMAEIVQKQQQAHGVYENTNGMPMANGKNLHMEVSACCPFLALCLHSVLSPYEMIFMFRLALAKLQIESSRWGRLVDKRKSLRTLILPLPSIE
jgi:hypothetical protein